MSRISVTKNVSLSVRDWGAGKTIVLVHGWPLDQRIFEYAMMALAKKDCRVVSIDLRGFGESDKPWDGNDYDTWAADIGKVIAELILRDVTLAGFSLGAAVCAHYVARRIDTRISKLALISAPVPAAASRPEERQVLEDNMKALLQDRPRFVREYIRKMMSTDMSQEYLDWLASMGMQASLRATVRGLEELRDRDLRGELGNIRLPARFFHGAKDKIVPISMVESPASLIKSASLVRFEDSGHGIFWDERDRLVEELDKFAGEKLARVA